MKAEKYVIVLENGELLEFRNKQPKVYKEFKEAVKDLEVNEIVAPVSSLPFEKRKEVEKKLMCKKH
jgi:hypothetical protein|nr:MAG TPA: hypothetical protein [Caudoviricetes sp.]